jgi:hypothetical protein
MFHYENPFSLFRIDELIHAFPALAHRIPICSLQDSKLESREEQDLSNGEPVLLSKIETLKIHRN